MYGHEVDISCAGSTSCQIQASACFTVPNPSPVCCKVCRWISSFPCRLFPRDEGYLAAQGVTLLQCIILGYLPQLSWAPSPCQRLQVSTLWPLQLKSMLISENIYRNLHVSSPSTGFFVRGRDGQNLTLAAHGKDVTNILNIFAPKLL